MIADLFAALWAEGRLVDLVLVVLVIEAIGLFLLHRFTGKGPAPADLIGLLGAGAGLVLALRSSLLGAPPALIIAFLTLAFAAHLYDLACRFRA